MISQFKRSNFDERFVDFLGIKVYASENYLCDDERLQVSTSRLFASLRRAFSKSDVNTEFQPLVVQEVKVSRSALMSKYLEDYQVISKTSLCKRMMKIASIKPIILTADQSLRKDRVTSVENCRSDLEEISNLLVKLKKYLSRRTRSTSPTTRGDQISISTQTMPFTPCDKAVQCSKISEFLKVSPDLKFFSRSSLLMNVESDEKSSLEKPRRNSATSLQYVANYRPEFRSFSSSAILRPPTSVPPIRSRRRVSDRLKDTLRQTEDDFLRFSNFVEDDLLSIRHWKTKSRHDDVMEMKKVLLEDYITEVKEIIRSESQILQSVKSRMDQDLPIQTDNSWCSLDENRQRVLSPCTSYETARECHCSCVAGTRSCCGEGDGILSCEALVLCTDCSLRARQRIAARVSCCGDERAKSSSNRSLDSGVLLDCRSSSTSENKPKEATNDELLCQRVETAVRKFTEELILCERRTRDRSTRRRSRRQKRKFLTSTSDQSRNSSDEEIAGISTPSLVSLSDLEDVPNS